MSTKSHAQILLIQASTEFPYSLFAAGERGVWLDSSDFSTMWQDSAGTTPVTGTGQPIGLWHDKSGNGNHFIQPTSGNRPVLQNDGTNYYAQFTAANSSYLKAAYGPGDPLNSDGLSISVVSGIKLDTATGSVNRAIIARAYYGSFGGRWWSSAVSSGNMEAGAQFAATNVASAAFSSTAITVCSADLVRDSGTNTNTNRTRVNKSQTASSSVSDTPAVGNPNLLTLIGAFNAANNTGPQAGNYFDGRIYQLIVRIANFDATMRTNTEDWVNTKCGAY